MVTDYSNVPGRPLHFPDDHKPYGGQLRDLLSDNKKSRLGL